MHNIQIVNDSSEIAVSQRRRQTMRESQCLPSLALPPLMSRLNHDQSSLLPAGQRSHWPAKTIPPSLEFHLDFMKAQSNYGLPNHTAYPIRWEASHQHCCYCSAPFFAGIVMRARSIALRYMAGRLCVYVSDTNSRSFGTHLYSPGCSAYSDACSGSSLYGFSAHSNPAA